jgi:hypothetical protein
MVYHQLATCSLAKFNMWQLVFKSKSATFKFTALGVCLCTAALIAHMLLTTQMVLVQYLPAYGRNINTDDDSLVHTMVQRDIVLRTQQWRDLPSYQYAGYGGPWIEELYYSHWSQQQIRVAAHRRIYLPVAWFNCHEFCPRVQKHKLQTFLLTLNTTLKYYTVLQIARGLHHPYLNFTLPDELDLVIFASGGRTLGPKVTNVIIPHIKPIVNGGLETAKKRINLSFFGRLETHTIRREMYNLFKKRAVFGTSKTWQQSIAMSNFSFAPRGYGHTSFRLYEVLQLGSIPIYIWDEDVLLPFTEMVDWNKICILVHRRELPLLHRQLLQVNTTSMQAAIKRVRHMFTFEFTIDYIYNHSILRNG